MADYAIAVGAKVNSLKWNNRLTSWDALVDKLRHPVVTAESTLEYAAMTKPQRDRVKDVGGFVGGALKGTARGVGQVQWRSMVTLDLDHVVDSVDKVRALVEAQLPFTWVLHATHSHTPKAPRLRIIIPLEESITEEQYEPVARRLAADVGMDMFDVTTFQASRLMFWPSVCSDGLDEYNRVFTINEGALCNGAEVLSRYTDWRNMAEWPYSGKELQGHDRAKTQQDPRDKKGPIGIFCRAYDMHEALATFLADVYTPTDKSDRYTFAAGSTFGGLVVYDDVFAFDNHGTSPTSGLLCNAFDLVRLHRFGALDEGSRVQEPTKLPSYVAMLEFLNKDEGYKRQQAAELTASLEDDFSFDDAAPEEDWRLEVVYQKDGVTPAKTIENFVLFIDNDPALRGRIFEDVFAYRTMVEGPVPWDDSVGYRDWSDTDDACLRAYLEKHYGIHQKDKTFDALNYVTHKNRKHPIREYFKGLPAWDGVPRVESLLVDYLGAEDKPYTRAVTRTHLVASVARIMVPGIKYDTEITLCGPQGCGKSTLIRKLYGDAYYSDSLRDFNGARAFEQLQGKWGLEIAELAAYKKSEKEDFKAFVSKTHDDYRQVYLRRTSQYPRQCVFWGTTNDAQFLRDVTGERRQWPVAVGVNASKKNVHEDFDAERDQIWAEALMLYNAGHSLILDDEMEEAANVERSQFTEEDARVYAIEAYLSKPLPLDWDDRSLDERLDWLEFGWAEADEETVRRTQVTALEVWCECFRGNMNDFPRRDNNEISNILNNVDGWVRGGRPSIGKKAYGDRRPNVSFVLKVFR